MNHIDLLRRIVAEFPSVTEAPHFEKTSFRVGKKIFATYDEKTNRATVRLSEIDQDVFCSGDPKSVYRVPNKWGRQGWTIIELVTVHPDLLGDAVRVAYEGLAGRIKL